MSDQQNQTPQTTPKIDITLLQTFHLVAKTGSFSGAARQLNISYQSAANHVRRLEQLHGAQLVLAEKGSRNVTLTASGRTLYAWLGSELETILARISLLMRDVHSIIRVGVPQALFHHFFPNIIHDFRQSHPDVQLLFYERDTVLETMMRDGNLDACICERFFGEASVPQVLFGEYRLTLIYPAIWRDDVDLSQGVQSFENKPFITYEPGQTIRSRAEDFLTSAFGKAPKISVTTSGSTSMSALVRAGVGYAVVPQWATHVQDDSVGKIVLDDIEPVKVYFGCSAFLENDPLVKDFRETTRDHMVTDFLTRS